eukprot:960634-Rhodomonas_salina.3
MTTPLHPTCQRQLSLAIDAKSDLAPCIASAWGVLLALQVHTVQLSVSHIALLRLLDALLSGSNIALRGQ